MNRFIKRKELLKKEENEYAEEVYSIVDTKTNKEYELNSGKDIEAIIKILNKKKVKQ